MAEMEQMDKAWLTSAEAAVLFKVHPKTISRWAKAGKLPYVTTLGGHRRYPADEVRMLAPTKVAAAS